MRVTLYLFLPAAPFLAWSLAFGQPLADPFTTLRFEVSAAPGLLPEPISGRVLVTLVKDGKAEPRLAIGQTGKKAPPILGRDVQRFGAGSTVVLDEDVEIFPLTDLGRLPVGQYAVQAVLVHNPDLNLPDAPGNLYSLVQVVTLDPAKGGTVKLTLSKAIPAETLPADTADVKYIKLRSELLSKFHGRDMYLRTGLILPRDFAKEPKRHYPLRVHIGGYGTRFSAVEGWMKDDEDFAKMWRADDTPRLLLLHLDGAGPYGDPYQVNSANNGPYGDAVTRELIPYVEKTYRGLGTGQARVLDGASTGGWVSLALQIFYPEFFNGAWSHCPDPVDFRAFELINIYEHANAYKNPFGFERTSTRTLGGDTQTTVRHECAMEGVLGLAGRWELSGKDWCAWNATFGPRGKDGYPRPLWDGNTGKIERGLAEQWKPYDLRLVLEKNWPALAPKLRGKLRIWVGDADEFFLNNAVQLLDNFLSKAQPAYEGKIVFGRGKGHSWRGISEKDMMKEMGQATGARP